MSTRVPPLRRLTTLGPRKWIAVVAIAIIAIACSVASESAFVAFGAAAIVCGLCAALGSGRARVAFVNLAAVAIAFEAFEAYYYFSTSNNGKSHPNYDVVRGGASTYFHPNSYLGYGPSAMARVRSRLVDDGRSIYDVVYTIDSYGLRAHPNGHPRSESAVLFFGCSFVFGEGVQDSQTLPFYFESFDDKKRKALNFGFHGYGPHQMLTILANRLDEGPLEGSKAQYGVYWALADHIRRVAGRDSWDVESVHYVVTSRGEVVPRPFWLQHLSGEWYETLERSRFLAHVLDITAFRNDTNIATTRDLDLFVAVVDRSAQVFQKRFGGKFVVMLADGVGGSGDWPRGFDVVSALRSRDITVYRSIDLAHTYSGDPAMAIPGDGHPSPLANERIARELVKRLQ